MSNLKKIWTALLILAITLSISACNLNSLSNSNNKRHSEKVEKITTGIITALDKLKINDIEYSGCEDEKEVRYEAIGKKLQSVYDACQNENSLANKYRYAGLALKNTLLRNTLFSILPNTHPEG